MKKFLWIVSLFVLPVLAFAQYPVTQTIGSSRTLVSAKGSLSADSGFVNAFYPDTTIANAGRISRYPNAQIIAGGKLYLRNFDATKWIRVGADVDSARILSWVSQKVDSVRINPGSDLDSVYEYRNGIGLLVGYVPNKSGIVTDVYQRNDSIFYQRGGNEFLAYKLTAADAYTRAQTDSLIDAKIIQDIKWSVIDAAQSPPTNDPGDTYLVSPGATGDFAGKENMIAVYDNALGWQFQMPAQGDLLFNTTSFNTYRWTGTQWEVGPTLPFIPLGQKAQADGVATLDNTGKVPIAQLPALTVNQPSYVQTMASMLALSASVGDIVVVGDSSKSYALMSLPANVEGNWLEIKSPVPDNTDLISEGATNKYYTNARARSAISVTGNISYNANTGVITGIKPDWNAAANTDAEILNKPVIPAQFAPVAGGNISITGSYPNMTFAVTGMIDDNNSSVSTTYSSDKINGLISNSGSGDMLKSVYDPTGKNADAFDYDNLYNTPTIPAQFNPTAGSNITITGTYPNLTFSASGGGGGGTDNVIDSLFAYTPLYVEYDSASNKQVIGITKADPLRPGYISASDFNNFAGKLDKDDADGYYKDINYTPINDASPSASTTYSSDKINSLVGGIGGVADGNTVSYNYVIHRDGGFYKSEGDSAITKTNFTELIQQIIDTLFDRGGGNIYIRPGQYSVTNSIVIDGDGSNFPPHISVTGAGNSTILNPSTGVDAIILQNKARVTLKSFRIDVAGVSGGSAIIGSSHGGTHEMSLTSSDIDGISITSNSTIAVPVVLENFMNINVGHLAIYSATTNNIELVNNSATINYGNSIFDKLDIAVPDIDTAVGLVIRSNNSHPMNLLKFNSIYALGAGNAQVRGTGIKLVNAFSNTFGFVDLEYLSKAIKMSNTSNTNVLGGYVLIQDTAVVADGSSQVNRITLFAERNTENTYLIKDASSYPGGNTYYINTNWSSVSPLNSFSNEEATYVHINAEGTNFDHGTQIPYLRAMGTFGINNYSFPDYAGTSGQILKLGSGNQLAWASDDTGGGGGGTTNLSAGTNSTTTFIINNSNGTGVTIPAATTSTAGLISSTDKTKLNGLSAPNNATLTLATSGIATGSASFTANASSPSTFTVNVPSQINDASASGTSTYSSTKINSLLSGLPTPNNATLTLATSGIATGSASFTANSSTPATFTVNVPSQINDGSASGTSTYSSTKINSLISGAGGTTNNYYTKNRLDVTTVYSSTYTPALADTSFAILMSSGNPDTVLVPNNSAVAFPIGSQITFTQAGGGQTVFRSGRGVKIVSADNHQRIRTMGGTATLIKTATNDWLLVGDLIGNTTKDTIIVSTTITSGGNGGVNLVAFTFTLSKAVNCPVNLMFRATLVGGSFVDRVITVPANSTTGSGLIIVDNPYADVNGLVLLQNVITCGTGTHVYQTTGGGS